MQGGCPVSSPLTLEQIEQLENRYFLLPRQLVAMVAFSIALLAATIAWGLQQSASTAIREAITDKPVADAIATISSTRSYVDQLLDGPWFSHPKPIESSHPKKNNGQATDDGFLLVTGNAG